MFQTLLKITPLLMLAPWYGLAVAADTTVTWHGHAVPHHFGTFPVLNQSSKGFAAGLEVAGIHFIGMEPGGTITFKGHELAE